MGRFLYIIIVATIFYGCHTSFMHNETYRVENPNFSIVGQVYKKSQCNEYSNIEVRNNSNETCYLFFSDKVKRDSINIPDFLFDRFFLVGDFSMHQLIHDNSVAENLEPYSTFVKRIKTGDKFVITTEGDKHKCKNLADDIIILSHSDLQYYPLLKSFDSLDSWIFNTPDTINIISGLSNEENDEIEFDPVETKLLAERVREFLCSYYNDIFVDKMQRLSTPSKIINEKYHDNFYKVILQHYNNSAPTNILIFENEIPSIDFCESMIVSVDSADFKRDLSSVKIHLQYNNVENRRVLKTFRILKYKPEVYIAHIYNSSI